jgi:hypothetical protein
LQYCSERKANLISNDTKLKTDEEFAENCFEIKKNHGGVIKHIHSPYSAEIFRGHQANESLQQSLQDCSGELHIRHRKFPSKTLI